MQLKLKLIYYKLIIEKKIFGLHKGEAQIFKENVLNWITHLKLLPRLFVIYGSQGDKVEHQNVLSYVNFNFSCIFKNPNIYLRLRFGLVNSNNTNLRYVVGGQNVIRAKTWFAFKKYCWFVYKKFQYILEEIYFF